MLPKAPTSTDGEKRTQKICNTLLQCITLLFLMVSTERIKQILSIKAVPVFKFTVQAGQDKTQT